MCFQMVVGRLAEKIFNLPARPVSRRRRAWRPQSNGDVQRCSSGCRPSSIPSFPKQHGAGADGKDLFFDIRPRRALALFRA